MHFKAMFEQIRRLSRIALAQHVIDDMSKLDEVIGGCHQVAALLQPHYVNIPEAATVIHSGQPQTVWKHAE